MAFVKQPGDHLRAIRLEMRTQRYKKLWSPSQEEFATRYGLSLGALRDLEQGRSHPVRAMRTLIVLLELEPALVERAAKIASERWDTGSPD